MKTIVLISCTSKKRNVRSLARDLYSKSTLFQMSLAYAERLKPDSIFILSALHHLTRLDDELDPYDVTLRRLSSKERQKKPHVKVLTPNEATEWGLRVVQQLHRVADLDRDRFVVLAGSDYLKPIQRYLKNVEEPLRGLGQGKRLHFLREKL